MYRKIDLEGRKNMARKIKICPKCKTWTAGKGEYCGDCGETLIETGYTDMFFYDRSYSGVAC